MREASRWGGLLMSVRTWIVRVCVAGPTLAGMVLGCGGTDIDSNQKPLGEEGGGCFANGTCFPGLSCFSSLCVRVDAGHWGADGGPHHGTGGGLGSGGSMSTGGAMAIGGSATTGG